MIFFNDDNLDHEIRTKLQVIIGFSQLILIGNQEQEWNEDMLKKIEMAGEELLRLYETIMKKES